MADKHPKRPRDFSQAAKLVVDIASGQIEDREPTPEERGVDPGGIGYGPQGWQCQRRKTIKRSAQSCRNKSH